MQLETEGENIHQDCFCVPHASAAFLNATNDPSPGLDVSEYLVQADCGPPRREQETLFDPPGCMDLGEPFVVSKGRLLTW